MLSRATISRKLSRAVQAHAVSIAELCQALGINALNLTASQLWERILDRYLEA